MASHGPEVASGEPCSLCRDITYDAIVATGDLGFPHHESLSRLQNGAKDCPICSLILEAIQQLPGSSVHQSSKATRANVRTRSSAEDAAPKANITLTDLNIRSLAGTTFIRVSWNDYIRDITDEDNEYHEVSRQNFLIIPQDRDDIEVKPAGYSSSAEPCYGRIKDWLTSCSSSHTLCAKESSFIPPRLIHVGSDEQKDPYLVDTSASDFPELSSSRRYVALSYCWGKAGNLTTTSATLEERKQRIPFEGVSIDGNSLPQSIKDAITITRRLGWQYLWVDALCILQGPNEEAIADWQNQSGMMGEIYGNAYVTIAAAGASDVHGGIFHQRDSIEPVIVHHDGPVVRRVVQMTSIPRGPSIPAERVYLSTPPTFVPVARGSIFDEPLYKRAWALQERILSRRVITYGTDEITWQCRTCVETETGSPSPETTRSLNSFEPKTLGVIWPRIVTQYSHFAATRSTDKLPALSGLVRTIQSEHKCTYIAGLWESTICNDLLWRADSPRSLAKPAQYRAPSWSWASLDGSITNIPRDGADMAQLVNSSITLAGLDPAGEVSDGYISIRGPFGLFPRLGKPELISELTQKLDIFDSKERVIGGAFLDIADFPELPLTQPNVFVRIQRRIEKFGLQTKPNAGVILIRSSEKEDVYARVGMFMLNAAGKSWASQMEKKKIKII